MSRQNLVQRFGVFGVVLALVAGCSLSSGASSQPTGTTTPSAALPATASPTPTSAAAPSASPSAALQLGWPHTTSWQILDALFGEDGRVVMIETDEQSDQTRVNTLAADGTVLDGWPWTPAGTGSDTSARAALGPDDSVYVAVRGKLHRLSSAGTELPGFPVDLPSLPWCGLDAAADGSAFVTCQDEDEEAGTTSTVVTAIRPDGSTAAGWPVRLAGSGESVGFRPDGALVVGTSEEKTSTITVVGRDGRVLSGWPQIVGGTASITLDARGRVRITARTWTEGQCAPAARTVYSMLEPDGKRSAGWPISMKGWASDPEIADDGTMYVVTDAGRAVAYSVAGTVIDGWPVSKVDASVDCGDGSRPWAAGDGTIVVVGDGRATLLTGDGQMASGWPVTLPYGPASSCGFACTPGPAGPLAPVVGRRAVYIGAYQGDLGHGTDGTNTVQPRVMVVERDGSMPADAQLLIGKVGDALSWLRIAPTGRVWALVSGEDSAVLHLVAEDAAAGS